MNYPTRIIMLTILWLAPICLVSQSIPKPLASSENAELGVGYSSEKDVILQYSPFDTVTAARSSRAGEDWKAENVESIESIARALNVSVSAMVKSTAFRANADFALNNVHTTFGKSISWYISGERVYYMDRLRTPPELGVKYKGTLVKQPDRFRNLYGDSYISSRLMGMKVTILYQLTFQTEEERINWSAKFSGALGTFTSSYSFDAELKRELNELRSRKQLTVSVNSLGIPAIQGASAYDIALGDDVKTAMKKYLDAATERDAVCLYFSTQKYDDALIPNKKTDFERDFCERYRELKDEMANMIEISQDHAGNGTLKQVADTQLRYLQWHLDSLLDLTNAYLSNPDPKKEDELYKTVVKFIRTGYHHFDYSITWEKEFSSDDIVKLNGGEKVIAVFKYLRPGRSLVVEWNGQLTHTNTCDRSATWGGHNGIHVKLHIDHKEVAEHHRMQEPFPTMVEASVVSTVPKSGIVSLGCHLQSIMGLNSAFGCDGAPQANMDMIIKKGFKVKARYN